MIRRPPRSTLSSSSAASDVYKRSEVAQRTLELLRLLRGRALLRRETGTGTVQAEQRDVDIRRNHQVDARKQPAHLVQTGQIRDHHGPQPATAAAQHGRREPEPGEHPGAGVVRRGAAKTDNEAGRAEADGLSL